MALGGGDLHEVEAADVVVRRGLAGGLGLKAIGGALPCIGDLSSQISDGEIRCATSDFGPAPGAALGPIEESDQTKSGP